MGVVLAFLLSLGKETLKVGKIIAAMFVNTTRQIKGYVVGGFLLRARSLVLEVILMATLFALIRTTLGLLMLLLPAVASWVGIVEGVGDFAPSGYHGVIGIVWDVFDLDTAFGKVVTIFSAWLSGWGVYKSLEYEAVIRRFASASGYWSRLV